MAKKPTKKATKKVAKKKAAKKAAAEPDEVLAGKVTVTKKLTARELRYLMARAGLRF